jgi:hypothetical protein
MTLLPVGVGAIGPMGGFGELHRRGIAAMQVSQQAVRVDFLRSKGASGRPIMLRRRPDGGWGEGSLADGGINESERNDLEAVTRLLALDKSVLNALIEEFRRGHPARMLSRLEPMSDSLEGKTVCFTGSLCARLENQLITREIASELATAGGLLVVEKA